MLSTSSASASSLAANDNPGGSRELSYPAHRQAGAGPDAHLLLTAANDNAGGQTTARIAMSSLVTIMARAYVADLVNGAA